MALETSEIPTANRPHPGLRWLELRAPFEFASLLPCAPWLLNAPKGDDRPILLAPGYYASGRSLAPLSSYLRYLGYKVYDWGLGTNRGNVEEDIVRLAGRVQSIVSEDDEQPLTLIGWSLGGVIVRDVARMCPVEVREVITMGSPIIGGPKYTSLGSYFASSRGMDLNELELEVHRRNSEGLTQPFTSIYSKEDAIVGWESAIDTYNPQARNIQVNSSHIGLGVNPQVWMIIARTLAKSG